MSDIDAALRRLVIGRSQGVCEYCRVPTALDESPACVDHIVARKHRGPSTADNLALACFHDNSHKGDNLAGLDPDSLMVLPFLC
jgi:5-methylcytosine-specific restriction endonuclease McrA